MSERMELIKRGNLTPTGRTSIGLSIPTDQVDIMELHGPDKAAEMAGSPYLMYKDGPRRIVIDFPEDKPSEVEGEKKPGEVFQ